jgi:hypothetical protein
MDANVTKCNVTKFRRDYGRDDIGSYRIGSEDDNIDLEFALEAKCYEPTKGAGIRETSRLISSLKHGEFGVFVNTSYVSQQAYEEIWEDGHPVIIISGKDIATILVNARIRSTKSVSEWLTCNFPT